MHIVFIIIGVGLLAVVAIARFFFLARWRVGWAMYLCNVVWEFAEKNVHIRRFWFESVAAVLGLLLLLVSGVVFRFCILCI